MENTSALLFDNKQARYFLAIGGKAVGPLTAQDLYERLSRGALGECNLLSHVWSEGWDDWKTISQIKEFAALAPQKPDRAAIEKIQQRLTEKRKKAAQKAPAIEASRDEKLWYLYFKGSQFGPFSEIELLQILDVQKVDARGFLWTPGWPQWKPIALVPDFAAHVASPPAIMHPPVQGGDDEEVPVVKKSPKKGTGTKSISKSLMTSAENTKAQERRGSPRRPLIAKLFLHNDKEVIVAVCRDISVGGMQVLTDHVPGDVGTVLKLNVSPSGTDSVKGFVAEGEIVRVLEDGRGFSFRFKKISPEARKAIEAYIKSS